MLPTKLAFVDIETTGGRSSYDRIIEIGIVQSDGGTLLDTYSTLINPGTHIPPEIEQLTGITANDVENAPSFREVAPEIIERLKDFVFVAHNVRFDYGFLKAEFARLGYTFSSKHFCTVRLSRHLYPTLTRHNLDSIIERLNLECRNRHRALDDAKAIFTFFQKAKEHFPDEIFTNALKTVLKKPYLPVKLSEEILDSLPEAPGVYIFYGKSEYQNTQSETFLRQEATEGHSTFKLPASQSSLERSGVSNLDIRASSLNDTIPLYIGKSINIKDRVLSHFSGDLHSPLEMKIAQQVESVETIETAGEFGALFLESQLIKQKLPLYNKMLRRKRELISLRQKEEKDGYFSVEMEPITTPDIIDLPTFIGFFRSRKQAKDFLSRMAKEHELCERLLGLEKASAACFGYRLERCKGACVGKELPVAYNIRFLEAFGKTKIKRWPFPGPIIIEEKNEITQKTEYFLIDQWCYLGSVQSDQYGTFNQKHFHYSFDLDTYKILVRFLTSPRNEANIRLVPNIQQNFSHI